MPQRVEQGRHRAERGDELTHRDAPVRDERGAVPDHRDHQRAREHHLDRGDQRPHPGAAHGCLADFLRGLAVAAEEQLLTADAAQHAQARDGVGRQLGGLARLLPLDVGALGGARQQRQRGQGDQRDADGHDHAELGGVEQQPDADEDDGEDGREETRDRLDEPSDLLHVARGHRDHFTRGDPLGEGGAQLGGLARQELLHPCRGGDPVGDGRAVEHGVADRDGDADDQEQRADAQQSVRLTVDDRVDAEADGVRQRGDTREVQHPPAQAFQLSAELTAPQPQQEPGAGTSVGYPWIRIRKIADLHDAP